MGERVGERVFVCVSVCLCVCGCLVGCVFACLCVCVCLFVCGFVCLVLWLFCYWFGPLLAARVFDWLVVVSVCVCLLVFVSVSYCMSVWLPPQAGPHTQGHLHIGLGRCRIPGGGWISMRTRETHGQSTHEIQHACNHPKTLVVRCS